MMKVTLVHPVIDNDFLKKRPLSASSLKAFWESPKHYIEYIETPFEDSDAFILGRTTEDIIYSEIAPKQFKLEDKVRTYEKFDKRSNAAKEKWVNMLMEAKENKYTLVDEEIFKKAKNMADCAMQTDETRYYLDRVATDKKTGLKMIQTKLSWIDVKTKLPIIGHIDFMVDIEDHLIIVDIKTTRNGNPDKFVNDASNMNYHIQVGTYLTGYHKQHYLFPDFMFMAIDSGIPHDAIMEHCPSDYCQTSKDEFEHLLTGFRHCMDTNQFHRGRHFWSAEMGYFTMSIPRYKKLKLPSE